MKILLPFFVLSSYVYAFEAVPEAAAPVKATSSSKSSAIKVPVSKEDPYDISDKAIAADSTKTNFVNGLRESKPEVASQVTQLMFASPELYAFALVFCSQYGPNVFLDYLKASDDIPTQAIDLLYKSNPKLFVQVIKKFEKLPFMEASLCGSDLALDLDALLQVFATKLQFVDSSKAVERIFKESDRVARLLPLFKALHEAEQNEKHKMAVLSAIKLSLGSDKATLDAVIAYIDNFPESYLKELKPSHLSSADPVRVQQLIEHASKDELAILGELIKEGQFSDALKLCNARKIDLSVPDTREILYGQKLYTLLRGWMAEENMSGLDDPFRDVLLPFLHKDYQFKRPAIQAPATVSKDNNNPEKGGDKAEGSKDNNNQEQAGDKAEGSKDNNNQEQAGDKAEESEKPKTRRVIRKKKTKSGKKQ